ncbi:MAG TPA: restriction endonuclease subunit S, partial [Thermoanaerobaculia bacterium]|nr:restriction endonuclease subunit S [Thermoanaerobaculia bacterium]
MFPNDWYVAPLGELATIRSGGTPSRSTPAYWGGDIPWVTTGEVKGATITTAQECITRKGLERSAARLERTGTILIALYGQGPTRGRVARLGIEAATNQACAAIAPRSALLSEFLFHFLIGNYDSLRGLSNKGSQDNLSGALIKRFEISVPPIPEQCAISEALSDADRLLGEMKALIAKKRAVKQAVMQLLLTGKTRLLDVGGEWEMKQINNLATVDPENLSSSTDPDFSFNYISLEQVDAGRLLGVSVEVFRTAPSRARRVLRHDDVLMSTVRPNLMAHLHFTSQIPLAVCSTGFAVLRARPDAANAGYLFAHLFGYVVNSRIERILAGSNYPAISSRDVRMIELPCPPTVAEQTAIAAVLSDMD